MSESKFTPEERLLSYAAAVRQRLHAENACDCQRRLLAMEEQRLRDAQQAEAEALAAWEAARRAP